MVGRSFVENLEACQLSVLYGPQRSESSTQFTGENGSSVFSFSKNIIPFLPVGVHFSGGVSHIHHKPCDAGTAEVNQRNGPIFLDGFDDGHMGELIVASAILVSIPCVVEKGNIADVWTFAFMEYVHVLGLLKQHLGTARQRYVGFFVGRTHHAGAIVSLFLAIHDNAFFAEKAFRSLGDPTPLPCTSARRLNMFDFIFFRGGICHPFRTHFCRRSRDSEALVTGTTRKHQHE